MTTYNEFLPWQHWRSLPENRSLDHDQALKKYNVDRNEHLKKMIYQENQQKIRESGGGGD